MHQTVSFTYDVDSAVPDSARGEVINFLGSAVSHSHQNDPPRIYWRIHKQRELMCLIGHILTMNQFMSQPRLLETKVNSHKGNSHQLKCKLVYKETRNNNIITISQMPSTREVEVEKQTTRLVLNIRANMPL
jgi:hypothetical protein